MINNIEQIKTHSVKYIREFLNGCTIEEKIDTHYVSVDIISRNEIVIRKTNGNPVDRVDLILNSMWQNIVTDWNYLKIYNADWFAEHVGYSIKMFYFPCDKPLLTEYNSSTRYVFDRVMYDTVLLDTETVLSTLKFPDTYKVGYKRQLNKVENVEAVISDQEIDEVISGGRSVYEIVTRLIGNTDGIIAKNEPEGFVFKYGKKIFQTCKPENRRVETEKSSYEFLLADFIKYCRTSDYMDKIGKSYTRSVCSLFNDYIINNEGVKHTIENNIDAESIENPMLGEKFDLNYDYIPDQVTKSLCMSSVLYKNIFKVLMANLRRGKDVKHCILLNKKQVDEWNTIMKNMRIRNIQD